MITKCFKKIKFPRYQCYVYYPCRFFHKVKAKNDLSKTRNIGILAHIDAGKTTTTERLLYYSGKIKTMGEVHKGNTVTDYMEQERNRGITITSACVTFMWDNHVINLVDTPGHIDFTVEVEHALNVIDSAVVVLDGTAGVEVQTVTVWRQADNKHLPRLVYANKMDRPDSDINLCENSLREKLGVTPFLLHVPIRSKGAFNSIADIVSQKILKWTDDKYIIQDIKKTDDIYSFVTERRNKLIDDLSSFDDKLADIILGSGSFDDVTESMLKDVIRKITIKNKGVPLICGSSYKNVGVETLLDGIIDFLPSPVDSVNYIVHKMCKDEFLAKTFKVMHNKQKGPLVFFRIYSGEISKNNKVFDLNQNKSDQVGYIYKPFADELTEVTSAKHGDFVAANGLKNVQNGDIICNSSSSASRLMELVEKHEDKIGSLLRGSHIPKPVIFCSIEPPSQTYQLSLERALAELTREDPSLQVSIDSESGQTVLGGMGELHLEIVKERLLTEYKIDVDIGPIQIMYKEKPLRSVTESHQLKNLIGTTEMQVNVTMSLKPGARKEVVLLDTTREASQNLVHITHRQLNSIKHGVLTAFNKGPLLSSEVIDCHVVLHYLEMNKRVPEPLLVAATAQCVEKMLKLAGTRLLEPVMEVNISVDDSLVSQVQTDLSRRRADIKDIFVKHNSKEIICEVPLSELVGYAKHLRTVTSGSARFTMEFKDFKEMTQNEQEKILSGII